MTTQRHLSGDAQPEPESSVIKRTLGLSEGHKRDIEMYVGVGERLADFICRAGVRLRSAAAYVRKSLAQRVNDPSA
jgi:hypothetical protein